MTMKNNNLPYSGRRGSESCGQIHLSVPAVVLFSLLLFVASLTGAIGAEVEDITPVPGISYSPLKQVVPGPGLPEGLKLRSANNNLDLVKYRDRFYFAWRNAITHFASRGTRLIIVSSTDAKKWDLEKIIHIGRDMREPRFLVYKDRLFFYYFSAGKNPWTFSPQHIWALEYKGPKQWTEPRKVWKPGYVVWRAKTHNGVALMATYMARGVTETKGDEPSEVTFLKSEDGINWAPYDSAIPVQVFGGGEAAFEFDAQGNFYTVVRNESGATKICNAPASNIAKWECKKSPMKYDSPLMFRHKETIYLVARRNPAGIYWRDVRLLKGGKKSLYLMFRYWITKKRTALYRYNTEKMEIEWLFDFPSRGDTAFPAITKLNENQYLLFNYSSPIDGLDRSWVGGQLRNTYIYSTVITFH